MNHYFLKKVISYLFVSFLYLSLNNTFAFAADSTWQKIAEDNLPYSDASISDTGESIVFYKDNQQNLPVTLWVSVKQGDSFLTPQRAVSLGDAINDSSLTIKSFATPTNQNTSINFNGPMIFENIITFSATASNDKSGIFYAKNTGNGYKIFLVSSQGDILPGQNNEKIARFDAPYILNNIIYYLVQTNHDNQYILSYNLSDKKINIILASNKNSLDIKNFWNISVNNLSLALRADQNGKQGLYRYDIDTQNLIPIYTAGLQGLNGLVIQLGGPSLFDHNIAFSAFGYDTKKQLKLSALYTDAAGHDLNKPVGVTGQKVNNHRLGFTSNPTLMVNSSKEAYISFEASLLNPSKVLAPGVYLSHITQGENQVSKILARGDTFDQQTVKKAYLGPVSLRNSRLVVMVKFTDQKYGLYVNRSAIQP